ncbi:hypothetical protein CTZ27_11955 [Streptomyces griseocarneus]|nr:hypothetical protein CTZ27_11955 [Streptomyces griseocarneus]
MRYWGSEALGERRDEPARAVPEVVLLAGLPPYNAEAAVDGEETGVGLVPAPHNSRALRMLRQQDAAAVAHLPTDLRDAQQTAVHQALRTILSAHGFWIEDGPLGEDPFALGLTRPRHSLRIRGGPARGTWIG